MTEANPARRSRRVDAAPGGCWPRARRRSFPNSDDPYVGELCARRGAGGSGLNDAAAAGWRDNEFLLDPRWSEALAHLPDYLGNHVRVSVNRAPHWDYW